MKRPGRLEVDAVDDPSARDWSPSDYSTFGDQRLRPAIELLARVGGSPSTIVDLGCGAGAPTQLLARRWPRAAVIGVDHSEAMLTEARALDAAQAPSDAGARIEWLQAEVANWRPIGSSPDLIFSNACLHWLPDHETLLPRLLSYLAPGGRLAVQMPLNWPEPSHRLMREVLDDLGLASAVPTLYHRPVADPEDYFRLLRAHAVGVDLWTTTYLQVLEGDDAVHRWTRSTALRPVRNALGDDAWKSFDAEYRRRLHEAYPREPNGETLFPFTRLFLVAEIAAEA